MPEVEPWMIEKLRFDGVWRPEPWCSNDNWRAVRYTTERIDGRLRARREMDDTRSRNQQQAQARCDVLNATRMADTPLDEGPKRLI